MRTLITLNSEFLSRISLTGASHSRHPVIFSTTGNTGLDAGVKLSKCAYEENEL